MVEADTSKPVLVTDATGYVAGWLVKRLLDEGFTVHAAVRDPGNAGKRAHLDALADAAPGTLRYFRSDLLEDGSYGEAMQGCEVVFHTASPFTLRVADPQKELVEPAERGTRNVLEEANRTGSVKRVVVTSSCAAVYGDNADLVKVLGGRFTEADWNTTASLTHQPYAYSKVRAERKAWHIAGEQDRWRLVTVNPSLVLGPGINPFATSESFSLIRRLADGTASVGIPDLAFGVVDVRDVAHAHLAAGFLPGVDGRYIASACESRLPEIVRILRAVFGDAYLFPKRVLPKWLVWLVGPMVDNSLTRRMIARNVGHPLRLDNSKGVRDLGLDYRPLGASLTDMFRRLVDNDLISARGN